MRRSSPNKANHAPNSNPAKDANEHAKGSHPRPLFSKQQGDILITLARQTIAEKLGIEESREGVKQAARQRKEDSDTAALFDKHLGVFVTLHRHGALRGCIGSLEATESVWDGVIRNAVNAAFHDPRFLKLTEDEFQGIDLEVSILSESVPLEYTDYQDLLSQLEPYRHGVTIRKGHARATFLPQVWKQLPDKALFLSHLCQKAGLSPDDWKKGDLSVETYTVDCFEAS